MKKKLQKALKLVSALSFFLYGFLLTNSCTNSRTPNTSGLGGESKFEKVVLKGSGMDSAKLAEIPRAMLQFVSDRKIAGAVTLVAHHGKIVSFEAVGFQDADKKTPMNRNTIFRIASMSKPFVGAAIMMLQEEGKLQLDDPIDKYLPEYGKMWLVSESSDAKQTLVRPARKITIRDILTHTHGLAGIPGVIPISSIQQYSAVVSQLPMQFEPGSQWKYGGSGITAAARIVELLSGKPYEVFLAERIFKPLGMINTAFSVNNDNTGRVSSLYKPSADSGIESVKAPDWTDYPHPDGGLYSTTMDIDIWMQTILNMGTYNGTRILSEASVAEITKIQTGELETGFTEGMSYGLAFGVVRKPAGVTAMLSPGTFGHGGAFGTQEWGDPKTGTVYILMIQRTGFGNGDASDIRNSFQRIAADAIIN